MVNKIHYRYDFIGLSTDDKPTADENPKVVDGSTFYCSDNSKLYVWYKDQWYEKTATGGGGTSYTAGTGIDITDNTISVDTTDIQEKLTAGSNITISDENEISATDTTYSNFTGTDGTSAGTAGLVPAPATTDAGKFLKADGTWDSAGGGGPTVVQTMGNSTTDVMSQNATTGMVYALPNTQARVRIGKNTSINTTFGSLAIGDSANAGGMHAIAISANIAGTRANNSYALAIGDTADATGIGAVAIGSPHTGSDSSQVRAIYNGSIAIGGGAMTSAVGEMNIGDRTSTYGYNSSAYRLLSGVYDGQNAHDAVTVGQINATIDAINTALSVNIPHIGASS